ncbi:MFS transporter [Roseibium suaedae]|uniref:MFS transporter, FSR family, fosmidomycin resistance protein n=1 Tax=Roseibium suaedae TaxID=735517 RepID=A0A1M7AZK4_9HYPH|nr:MFS transporter [Roseibium suaedae]SHL48036.1 MFS transporter, FSR family, fosmidomycin resistance protein [Roseibium suaedae]
MSNAQTAAAPASAAVPSQAASTTTFTVIAALSFCHMLNDMMQSLLAGIYPILKSSYALDFGQIGMMTLTFQVTASLLQPLVGIYTDKHPQPYSLAIAMGSTFAGLILLAYSTEYGLMLVACALIGLGSAVFHPEASRIARMASGGRHGLAQSLFQVGGNFGTALGPLLAAFIVLPHGQKSVAWFCAAALLAMLVLWQVGSWYAGRRKAPANRAAVASNPLPRRKVIVALTVLGLLVFSKYIYLASLTNYYTFYLMEKFGVDIRDSQLLLFVFLGAVAAGTVIGGPVGDRIGRKVVIWISILGVLPFTLILPYANLFWTAVLTVIIGVVIASAFSAIIVFAQELVPSRIGLIAGLFFGFAFGIAGIGAAVLGDIADTMGIEFVYRACAFLPVFGILTVFLPKLEHR